ncbi:hypothetical protein KQ51_01406 [Candidatus Izimaplasma bacterium HR1]|nr:hypothetical protein KQ51_01406 [Candidatus Izimaplasma bacterium HR1]
MKYDKYLRDICCTEFKYLQSNIFSTIKTNRKYKNRKY